MAKNYWKLAVFDELNCAGMIFMTTQVSVIFLAIFSNFLVFILWSFLFFSIFSLLFFHRFLSLPLHTCAPALPALLAFFLSLFTPFRCRRTSTRAPSHRRRIVTPSRVTPLFFLCHCCILFQKKKTPLFSLCYIFILSFYYFSFF